MKNPLMVTDKLNAVILAVLSFFALPSFAADPIDLSSLTSAVNFSSVITAVLAIAAILMGVYVALKGVNIVLGMIKGRM